ncbi:helix-turn-helix transcriptional regulator [Bradyrhizobium sp. dw_411]|uniref:AraC family transcriptional regulator n=1 Tax=Bradyrhizobium sp. dw_411 TaxID=2720082 RepID=UPI001BCB7B41|nr:helix-turn-helix transcriptional regulator [Bradyrhizobium sp. dw_411]
MFETSDLEELKHFGEAVLGATKVDPKFSGDFKAHFKFFQLQDIGIFSGGGNLDVALEYPEVDYVRLQIALKGSSTTTINGTTTETNEKQSCTTGPDRASQIVCKDGDGLSLRVSFGAVERKLALLLGAQPKGHLEFMAATNVDQPHVRALHQMIQFCAQQLDSTTAELPPLALRELEQAIIVSFLCANRHSFSHLLEQDTESIRPGLVHRAEEFIEANWNKAITIESLVDVTGANARAIFRAFQRSRGYSPMAFAKGVRLNHAKQMLSSPGAQTSVAGVAFHCGFANLGHFAKEYREAFGERPSETLTRKMRGGAT